MVTLNVFYTFQSYLYLRVESTGTREYTDKMITYKPSIDAYCYIRIPYIYMDLPGMIYCMTAVYLV